MKALASYIARQKEWSGRTFGPGRRTVGLCKHIAKELKEIEAEPLDVVEWIDVVILALDGAWRAGHSPEVIVEALQAKQDLNFCRTWPGPPPEDQPSFHVK